MRKARRGEIASDRVWGRMIEYGHRHSRAARFVSVVGRPQLNGKRLAFLAIGLRL
jgi:hypothetical protein